VKLELENLERFGKGEGAVSRFNEWSITFLSDYIVQNHHLYVRKMIPVILMHADKVARVHAERWPYMIQVAELFAEIASELGSHMYKEEAILFPRLKQLEASLAAVGTAASLSSPLQLSAPITQMMSEHDVAGDIMARIRTLTDHYVLPEGGCNTFRTLLSELHDFERDLHQHVFLENNILFPKALLIEEAAQKRSFI
jgi:regulator of cell morphogenesis and NO signaling